MTVRPLVDHGRLMDVLGIEGELLAGSAHGAPAENAVPGCPGLTLGETVRHVGSQYRRTLAWVHGGGRPAGWQQQPVASADAVRSSAGPRSVESELLGHLRAGLGDLRAELAAHRPEEPCATSWPADPSHGFWRRRMAHESTVHRVDVQAAGGGQVDPVPADIALDGIDEVLTLWFVHRLGEVGIAGTHEATVAVRAGGHEWIARAGPTGTESRRVIEAEDTAGQADAVVSGEPDSMYLWLWGRLPDQSVSFDGDHDAAAQLWALLRLATR